MASMIPGGLNKIRKKAYELYNGHSVPVIYSSNISSIPRNTVHYENNDMSIKPTEITSVALCQRIYALHKIDRLS